MDFEPRPKKIIVANEYDDKEKYITPEQQQAFDNLIKNYDLPKNFQNNVFDVRLLWYFDLNRSRSEKMKRYIQNVEAKMAKYEQLGLTPPEKLISIQTQIFNATAKNYMLRLFTFRDKAGQLWWAYWYKYDKKNNSIRYFFARTNEDDDYMVRHQQMPIKTLLALSPEVYEVVLDNPRIDFSVDITNKKEEWLPTIPSKLYDKEFTIQMKNEDKGTILIPNEIPDYMIYLDDY
ncbi:hypothetical protein EFL77_09540 [Pediococcus pentosaceus]|uniref:hypothetical protein n=1 Tax=Pediococcus pentosaceus TaxID=1255 RepID=UPI00223B06C0|nr:hypothetical protein [Pediococcus pentosaceus]MCT1178730.1 hypothetical protein [Pediococcus pentosaceus]